MVDFLFNYDFSFVKTAWKMNNDEVEHRMWMYVSSFGNKIIKICQQSVLLGVKGCNWESQIIPYLRHDLDCHPLA